MESHTIIHRAVTLFAIALLVGTVVFVYAFLWNMITFLL